MSNNQPIKLRCFVQIEPYKVEVPSQQAGERFMFNLNRSLEVALRKALGVSKYTSVKEKGVLSAAILGRVGDDTPEFVLGVCEYPPPVAEGKKRGRKSKNTDVLETISGMAFQSSIPAEQYEGYDPFPDVPLTDEDDEEGDDEEGDDEEEETAPPANQEVAVKSGRKYVSRSRR